MRLSINLNEKPSYSPEYLALHKKFDVPLHGLTPEQTRFFHYAFRNEINVFFRKCDMTGETIMSQFPQQSPFKVFRHDLWWEKDFPVAEADYNPDESFFKQFRRLQLQVPRMSVACDSTMVNCPYVNCANHCKDCHMIFASGDNEQCFYCINLERSESTMNASIAHECTLCHEITSCRNCYNLDYSIYCIECLDSKFLYDCRRCRNCFLCVGLIGKKYCILNKQYSENEYKNLVEKIISDMRQGGEWSQFFPPYCSPHPLNNSMTHEYFEVDKKMAEKLGFNWMDKSFERKYDKNLVYTGSMIAADVKFSDIQGKVLICSKTSLPYNIQKKELELLQQKELPLPDKHWRTRFEQRDQMFIFPWKLQTRKTEDTNNDVLSPVPDKYRIREKAIA